MVLIFLKIDIKRLILILFLGLSLWYILSPRLFKANGVRVNSIEETAKCDDLNVGDVITRMDGNYIKNKQDFDTIEKSVAADKRVSMVVNGWPGSCIALDAGELGIGVGEVDSKGFRFGIDLVGGEKISLSGETELSYVDISYISDVLEKRLKVIGSKSSRIHVDDKIISIYVPTGSEIGHILTNGKFEAVIEEELKLTNGTGRIRVGAESYDVFWNGSGVIVEGTEYEIDEFFDIGGIEFKTINATNDSIIVNALVFDNADVGMPVDFVGYANYDTQSRQYQFNIPIELSESAGEKFSEITEGLMPLYGIGGGVLNGMLAYYLDGEEITRLSIPSDMAATPIETISIVGGESTMKEAVDKKMLIEIALEGKIENQLVVENIERFSGTMGWMIWVGEAVLISCLVVTFVIGAIRYKNLKVGAIGALVLGLEIIYIFGIAAISQTLLAPGWVIDAISLVGICAFSIISVVQMVLLSERFLKRRIVKRYTHFLILVIFVGFLILFTPLNRMGLALVIGSLFGALLTKPVYIDFLSGFR